MPTDDLAMQRYPLTAWSRMGTGWPGCQVLPRSGREEMLARLADVGKWAGPGLPFPPRARQVPLGSQASTHTGGCFPCSADLLPHPWLPSATWPRKRCHMVRGLLSLAYTHFGLCLGLG